MVVDIKDYVKPTNTKVDPQISYIDLHSVIAVSRLFEPSPGEFNFHFVTNNNAWVIKIDSTTEEKYEQFVADWRETKLPPRVS